MTLAFVLLSHQFVYNVEILYNGRAIEYSIALLSARRQLFYSTIETDLTT